MVVTQIFAMHSRLVPQNSSFQPCPLLCVLELLLEDGIFRFLSNIIRTNKQQTKKKKKIFPQLSEQYLIEMLFVVVKVIH